MKPGSTVAIVGVGLIGGSAGMAVRERLTKVRVIGIGRNRNRLNKALKVGAVDQITTSWEQGVADADLVIVCTPVGQIVNHVRKLAEFCKPGAVITDAGSTKQTIVRGLSKGLPAGISFVGSHPMAGSDKSGVQFADAALFEDRTVVVTPIAATSDSARKTVKRFWKRIGAKVIELKPAEHDRAVAMISHLPHVVSSVLSSGANDYQLKLAATGWKDTTRIAAADPDLWLQIFAENKNDVLRCIDSYMKKLDKFRQALETDNQRIMLRYLETGKQNRDALGS